VTWDQHNEVLVEWLAQARKILDLMYTKPPLSEMRERLLEFKQEFKTYIKDFDKARRGEDDAVANSLGLILHAANARLPRATAPKEWTSRMYDSVWDLEFHIQK